MTTPAAGTHPLVTFTPSAMSPEVLEAIFVKREPLAKRIVSSIKTSAGSSSKQHWLLVGPRGIGKTHLISLVYHRVTKAKALRKKLVVAWLREEAWEVASYLNLLEAVLRAVAEDQGGDTAALIDSALDSFLDLPPGPAERAAEDLLRRIVGTRTLLLIAENLDELFQGLGPSGQRSLRSLVENTDQVVILATTPSLFTGVSSHAQPFYGLFTVEHLHELELAEARDLLGRVAELRGDTKLAEFLSTPTAEARLRVISELAGGHPRIWVLFANCLSIELLDELVPLFVKMLDDLTPYYQERMRLLPPQQRRIVTYLADVAGAPPVKEIARACRLEQRSAAKLLGDLEAKGFVRRAEELSVPTTGDRRLTAYELREPLMRLCLDVKESRGKPLRLIVEFLREWYGGELFQILRAAEDERNTIAVAYVRAAFHSYAARFTGMPHPTDTDVDQWLQAIAFETCVAAVVAGYVGRLQAVAGFVGVPLSSDVAEWTRSAPVPPGAVLNPEGLERLLAAAIRETVEAHGSPVGAWLITATARMVVDPAFESQLVELLVEVAEDLDPERVRIALTEAHPAGTSAWLHAWRQAAVDPELQPALSVLEAAVEWRLTGDRRSLLALPAELRQVLEGIITNA